MTDYPPYMPAPITRRAAVGGRSGSALRKLRQLEEHLEPDQAETLRTHGDPFVEQTLADACEVLGLDDPSQLSRSTYPRVHAALGTMSFAEVAETLDRHDAKRAADGARSRQVRRDVDEALRRWSR